jgi:hypothetical protein
MRKLVADKSASRRHKADGDEDKEFCIELVSP